MISSFHPLNGRYPRRILTPQFTPLDRRVSLFPFPGVRAQELIADKRTPKKKGGTGQTQHLRHSR